MTDIKKYEKVDVIEGFILVKDGKALSYGGWGYNILWPLTLFVWFIEFCILDKIAESLQNYVDEQTKKVEEKKKVKKTAEDYLNGKGEL